MDRKQTQPHLCGEQALDAGIEKGDGRTYVRCCDEHNAD
jgi:hypothetical protein